VHGEESEHRKEILRSEQVATDEEAFVSAASTPITVIVQLAPGVDPNQVGPDYQATVVGSIPALSFYRLQGSASDLLARLAGDSRVVLAQVDDLRAGFEAKQSLFNANGTDYDYLQRYFGFGSGDTSDNDRPKKTERARIVKGEKFDESWKTWGMSEIKLDPALKKATGAGITVAVLDTGVDLNHPQLVGRLVPGYDFVDNDDQPDDLPNGINDDEDGLFDEGVGHGTHIAGIITAMAPDAKVMPVRVLNSDGAGTLFDVVQGVVFAADRGAQVINLSFSAGENSPFFAAAINYALDRRVVLVAAAASDAGYLEYPAAYLGVIAVGATKKGRIITDFSLPHAQLVDVFAPGELIYSTYTGGGFAWWSGTSMAAPFVSAEAAILLQKAGSKTCVPGCIRDAIIKHVDNISPAVKGKGNIQVDKAVKGV
jgi:subtilisin family serine protease